MIHPDLRDAVFSRDGMVCQYCGTTEASSYHLDHVIPEVAYGPADWHNLVVACEHCNRRKNAYVWVPRNLNGITWRHRAHRQLVLALAKRGKMYRRWNYSAQDAAEDRLIYSGDWCRPDEVQWWNGAL